MARPDLRISKNEVIANCQDGFRRPTLLERNRLIRVRLTLDSIVDITTPRNYSNPWKRSR